MKIATCLFVLLGALSLAASPALAAQTVLGTQKGPITLRTGTAGGQCMVTAGIEPGAIAVVCDDGAGNRAIGDSFRGCVTFSGSGRCVDGIQPSRPFAEQDVQCTDGHTFTMTTGNEGGNCANTYDSGKNLETAECSDGLGNVSKVDCSLNGGKGNCNGTKGSGDCDCQTCAKNPS